MGIYFNPGNEAFRRAINSPIYIDKSMLIQHTNICINSEGNCIALSHARRFGKSQAAGMLKSYYSRGCGSRPLFDGLELSTTPDWDKYLNKLNVIHLDISTFANQYKENMVEGIINTVYRELTADNEALLDISNSFATILNDAYEKTNIKFVIIIDEWDFIIRNYSHNEKFVHEYMSFLHGLFKSEESKNFLALGYITGILPIKKIKDESALNNFREFTMINSKSLTRFYGFTEDEVKELCEKYNMNFDSVHKWYNGYLINGVHMYNPNSVYQCMLDGSLESYWKNTSAYSTINDFITMNFDGLKDDVLDMLAGGRTGVDVTGFQNDLSIISDKDDALTALIHLGYLAYDAETEETFIPNYEVAMAYSAALRSSGWNAVAESISVSTRALNAIINGNAEILTKYIDKAHEAVSV